jgi:peptidyl-prolyl cis-trans isomerase A (cyclophilin A)
MAQFGIPGSNEVADEWRAKHIKDDPVIKTNARGYISFATSGADSRTTQMFINLVDNSNLDDMGFSPFGGE